MQNAPERTCHAKCKLYAADIIKHAQACSENNKIISCYKMSTYIVSLVNAIKPALHKMATLAMMSKNEFQI